MNYLQLVNGVLTRMREDPVSTLATVDDTVALIVMDFVNDAMRLVEDAHNWNAQREEWIITTTPSTATYPLTDAKQYAKIDYIYSNSSATHPQLKPLKWIKQRKSQNDTPKAPVYYSPNGTNTNGDIVLELYPIPDDVYTYSVGGFVPSADLAIDSDTPTVPSKPVLYYALAYALRERGEVGGQTAAEVFAMAGQYLSDAIAIDATNNDLDNDWYVA